MREIWESRKRVARSNLKAVAGTTVEKKMRGINDVLENAHRGSKYEFHRKDFYT